MQTATKPRRRLRLRALLALIVGLGMTAALSYMIFQLQHDNNAKNELAFANEYARSLELTLAKRLRILPSIAGQVMFDEEDITRKVVLENLNNLSPLLNSFSQENGIRFMSWVPVWVGRNKNGSEDIVSLDVWQKQMVFDFILRKQRLWDSLVTKPNKNDSAVFGVDLVDKWGNGFLVVGQPFFQNFDLTGTGQYQQQFALGYLLGWLDLAHLMRRSWENMKHPDHLIYLRERETDGDVSYLSYQSGLVQLVDDVNLHPLNESARVVDFSLGEKSMTLRVVSLQNTSGSLIENLHLIVFVTGLLSTLLWSFLLIRVSQQSNPDTGEEQHISFEDYNRKLANETAQRQVVEDVLRLNEARWHFVVDNLPVALFAVDSTGMFTLGEGKGVSALGLEPGGVEGRSVFDAFEGQTSLINAIRECLSGEEIHEKFEINRHCFDMRFSPVVRPQGGFEGMICVATDVTAERHMQDRLDKVNLHLRGIMDNVPTGVALVRGGIIQWCSRHLEEIFGFDHNELSGRSPEILYSSTLNFRKVEEEARQKLLNKEHFSCRNLFKRKDRSHFIAEMTGRLVDQNNLQGGTMWVIQDLTALLEEEKERRLSQVVLQNIVEGVVVCNAQVQIVSTNKAFTSITGYTAKEVLGCNPSILASGRHDKGFYSQMWKDLTENRVWEGEIWNKRKNGESYLQWLTIEILEDENGEVEEYVGVFSDITKHRQTQEQLTYQANYDQLTGLPNRHLLADRFTQAAAQASREDKKFALVYFDLDNFKYLNESLGHASGDQIISVIAERLDHALRTSDTVARIGGDEFILLLMGAGTEDRISRVVAHLSMNISIPISLENHEDDIVMSASCGIAVFPNDGVSLAELTRKADSALHHAKQTERGLFKFFREEMNERAKERLQLEHKLRRAIEENNLVLFYQPKVDVCSHQIYGAEALIRWLDPELGMIGPDRFIPIAEETGLIVPIGEWVFKTACAQFKKWKDQGLPISNIVVNLSGRQFIKPDLAHDLIAIIHKQEMDPNCLEIEITESFIANNEAGTVEALNMFSQMGVKLSVDDFGTGYSSLNYLHRFPLDVMKIDRSFIMNIKDGNQEIAGNLAKAVIAIAHSMNLKLVGEGVENEVQLQFLKENGCDLVQGFYFSKPIPAEAFEKLLQDGGKM